MLITNTFLDEVIEAISDLEYAYPIFSSFLVSFFVDQKYSSFIHHENVVLSIFMSMSNKDKNRIILVVKYHFRRFCFEET